VQADWPIRPPSAALLAVLGSNGGSRILKGMRVHTCRLASLTVTTIVAKHIPLPGTTIGTNTSALSRACARAC
jgi:hypothetical protein